MSTLAADALRPQGRAEPPESGLERGAALLVIAIAAIAFLRPIWASVGDTVPGHNDALLNLYTLEQWYRWAVLSQGSWLGGGFFHPLPNTLGLTDTMFLLAVPYGLLRAAGLDVFTAYQATLYGSSLVACGAFYWFLRRDLGLRALPTAIGVVTAVFSNAMFLSAGHTQLFSYSLVPILCLLAFRLVDRLSLNSPAAYGYAAAMGAVVALFLFTGFYLAWFALLLGALVLAISLARPGPRRLVLGLVTTRRGARVLATMLVAFAVALIPFVLAYLPALREVGGRPYGMVEQFLPRWFDLVNVSYDNLLWGWVLQRWFPVVYDSPVYSELFKGMSPFVFALFAASTAICLAAGVRAREAAAPGGWTVSLAVTVAIAVLVCWALLVRWPMGSPWKLVYEFVPGATAVRAVFRFNLVLAFAAGLVIAAGLTVVARLAAARSAWCAGAVAASTAMAGLVVSLEQINIGKTDHQSKRQLAGVLANIGPAPAGCRYFFVVSPTAAQVSPEHDAADIRDNLLAMLASQVAGIPTLNGHSSGAPAGWGLTWISRPDYLARVAEWTRKRQTGAGLCSLELATGRWAAMDPAALPVPMTSELGEGDFRFTGTLEPPLATMRPGEQRQVHFLARNLGTRPWTSLSGEPRQKYAVNFSWRWVKGKDGPAGFDGRAPIEGVARPGETTRVVLSLKAPATPGDYVLEIDAVQEWVAFFRHKGNPTIRVPVTVR